MRNDEFFDSLRQTLTGTAEVVGKKTEDLLEIQKLRSRIRNAQRNVELDYKKLGEIIYQRYVSGTDLDEELTEVCGLIMELQKQTASYKEELANRKGQTVCPACGSGNPRDAVFCMHCGTVIPKNEPDAEDPYTAGPVQETDEAQEVWDACTAEAEAAENAAAEDREEAAEAAESAAEAETEAVEGAAEAETEGSGNTEKAEAEEAESGEAEAQTTEQVSQTDEEAADESEDK